MARRLHGWHGRAEGHPLLLVGLEAHELPLPGGMLPLGRCCGRRAAAGGCSVGGRRAAARHGAGLRRAGRRGRRGERLRLCASALAAGASGDPFEAAKTARARARAREPEVEAERVGFFHGDEAARAALPPLPDAAALLTRFDAEQMASTRERRPLRQLEGCDSTGLRVACRTGASGRAARARSREGGHPPWERRSVAAAERGDTRVDAHVRSVSPAALLTAACTARAAPAVAASSHTVMLGICAPGQDSALAALRLWTTKLGLPRGTLTGCDVDGVPVSLPPEQGVFVKYHSMSGNASLSAYNGDARGVLLNASTEESWLQCGYLPLSLLRDEPEGGAGVGA